MRDHRDRLSNQACGQASIDDDGDAREARRKLQGESEDDFLGSALRWEIAQGDRRVSWSAHVITRKGHMATWIVAKEHSL